jgi:hypothetical protein
VRELRVSVVDQEPHLSFPVVEFHQQLPRLLEHPGVWVPKTRIRRFRVVLG